VILRRASAADAETCARIQVEANRVSLPFLPAYPDFEGAVAFFRGVLLAENEAWIAEVDGEAAGYVAFRPGWLEHLYVHPDRQARGIGPVLLAKALEDGTPRSLWTFQKNARARKFYEARGWVLAELIDGAGNMGKEPDARYEWRGRLASKGGEAT
jgi:GNAT superfamily N-acetyltransferase